MKNLLVTLANQDYIDMAKQLFSSVYFNAGWQGEYMLLSYMVSEKDLGWFREKGILVKECHPLKNNARELPPHFAKLYIFTTEFKKWDNIIFLDADIIIRGSLDALTKIKGFAAVEDTVGSIRWQFMEENEQNKILFKNLKKGYKLNSSSFTSGVMAFSTDIIEENTFLQLSDLVQRYGMIFKSYEQAPLNLFFDKWQRLPIIYNLHDYAIPKRFKQRIEAIALHVTTWKYHSISQNLDAVIYNEWTKNLEMSELINLNEVIPSKKNWTEKEINKLDRKYKIWYKYWETIFKIRTFSRI